GQLSVHEMSEDRFFVRTAHARPFHPQALRAEKSNVSRGRKTGMKSLEPLKRRMEPALDGKEGTDGALPHRRIPSGRLDDACGRSCQGSPLRRRKTRRLPKHPPSARTRPRS